MRRRPRSTPRLPGRNRDRGVRGWGDDTYVRRLVEEETRRLEDAQFERWKS